jgi:hypothetical protein
MKSSIESKLRIFLSADLSGSTNYKFVCQKKGKLWSNVFAQYYRRLEANFVDRWYQVGKEEYPERFSLNKLPQLWKAIGDELVFSMKLESHIDTLHAIEAFEDVIRVERRVLKKISDGMMDVKGSAWIAGFPIDNSEVMLKRKNLHNEERLKKEIEEIRLQNGVDWTFSSEEKARRIFEMDYEEGEVDFIGPDIDTGFRIAKLSTPRKFGLSVDLAWLIGHAMINTNKSNKLDIYLDDKVSLKGVLDGKGYPFLFIDTEQNILRKHPHEKILGRKADHDVTEVVAFCKHFIDSTNGGLHIPYILCDEEKEFTVIPETHKAPLAALEKCFQDMKAKKV